ncbi:unnamed protein product [Enterobius vermicularis]|uniref:Endoribonuclease n=1 Tax=Enterobius vermicularis TaxID=51028 RepID=A0A0N4VQE4_ENTVE|nr:unnamed protein product [Enterobius vermicularis]
MLQLKPAFSFHEKVLCGEWIIGDCITYGLFQMQDVMFASFLTSSPQHVFVGEWRGSVVSGLHSWVRYYYLENSSAISYYGYHEHKEDFFASIQYSWYGKFKRIGSFNTGTSPAFDFAVFTLCTLVRPGKESCSFQIDDYRLTVTAIKTEDSRLITVYPVRTMTERRSSGIVINCRNSKTSLMKKTLFPTQVVPVFEEEISTQTK